MNKRQWVRDKEWADSFWPEIEAIIRSLVGALSVVERADEEMDMKAATDALVRVDGGYIAVRLRKPDAVQQGYTTEVTIRAWRRNDVKDVKTERAKLLEDRKVQWYLFAWTHNTDAGQKIVKWVFYDIWKAIDAGLFEKNSHIIYNRDGRTGFNTIKLHDLEMAGCILDQKTIPYSLSVPTPGAKKPSTISTNGKQAKPPQQGKLF